MRRIWAVAAVLLLLQFPRLGIAQEPVADKLAGAVTCAECTDDCCNPWKFRVIPYGWIPGFHGDVNAAAIGQVEASNGTFGVIVNGIYANVGVGTKVRNLDFTSAFSMTIIDSALTYRVEGLPELLHLPCGSQWEFLIGARYYNVATGVTVTGPRGLRSATADGVTGWADPIIGGRLRVPVPYCPQLTGQFRGDFGGFGIGNASQFTWNIETTLEYQMTQHISLVAGYRWLDIDRNSSSQDQRFGWNIMLSGPMVGVEIDF